MKIQKLISQTAILVLILSCANNKVDKFEGTYYPIKDSYNNIGFYTFNLNDSVVIKKNGANYLILNQFGNKIATLKNDCLEINNNRKLTIDNSNGNLILLNGSTLLAWKKEKFEKYMKALVNRDTTDYKINFNQLILNEFKEYPLTSAGLDVNYKSQCFGDFNKDNILPDFAFISDHSMLDMELKDLTLCIKNAGEKRIKIFKTLFLDTGFKKFSRPISPKIKSYTDKLIKYPNKIDMDFEPYRTDLNDKCILSTVEFYWNNNRYKYWLYQTD